MNVKISRFSLLMALLCVRLLLLGWYIQSGWIGLGPDEAQYWTWSRALDWGYYSKPPGIAWQIWLGTLLFGDTELGVRACSLLMGTLLPLVVYGLALRGGLREQIAFWAGIIAAFSPMGVLASLLAITDVSMVLAWTLACYPLLAALSGKRPCNYRWVGIAIACGALFKWPIYFLWIVIWIARFFFSPLREGKLAVGMLLSLLGLIPPMIWNYQHDWMTFRHVGATLAGKHSFEQGTTELFHGNLLEFIGAQLLLLSPVFFVLLVMGWINLQRQHKGSSYIPLPILFSGNTTALLLGAFAAIASVQKMQGNWCIFAYPLAFVTIAWYGCERLQKGVIVLFSGFLVSLSIIVVALLAPLVDWPLRSHPFKHNVGWKNITPALKKAGYHPKEGFLFADTYQTTSLLSFYGPGQERAYFLNLEGMRNNQFTQWPSMAEERLGQTGYFAAIQVIRNPLQIQTTADSYEHKLIPYFAKVAFVGAYPLVESHGEIAKALFLFRCEAYNGSLPVSKATY